MAQLYDATTPKKLGYYARKGQDRGPEYAEQMSKSVTCYLGNLSFSTTEDQVFEICSTVGPVSKVHMGVNRFTGQPCGFCFVLFSSPADCDRAILFLNGGARLDGRAIKAEKDPGFTEGRQYGRGTTGGQMRDELGRRKDPART